MSARRALRRGSRSATAVAAAAVAVGMYGPPAGAPVRLADHTRPLVTPFDVQDPSVGRLDPSLLTAIQSAANAANTDGIVMTINSGWRSTEFQQQLLDEAVQTYGSMAAARQYVQTPALSKHVTGRAVDVGGADADQWLIAHGARFGLCQIYANELWHFELAADAAGNCPALLPNAAG